jgi:beta-lactam-binding protein with PASTA domain
VIGLPLGGAKSAVERSHCAVGLVSRKYASLKKGRVVSQSPRAGRQFPSGSTVNLVVSRGRRPR